VLPSAVWPPLAHVSFTIVNPKYSRGTKILVDSPII
jgi:hypothetical protein